MAYAEGDKSSTNNIRIRRKKYFLSVEVFIFQLNAGLALKTLANHYTQTHARTQNKASLWFSAVTL